jgi:hypothetical protein
MPADAAMLQNTQAVSLTWIAALPAGQLFGSWIYYD